MLKDLEAERNLYEMRQIFPLQHDVFGRQDVQDILEHSNEEELNEWKGREYTYRDLIMEIVEI